MKLWPFSKKSEPEFSAEDPGMELPSGVTIALDPGMEMHANSAPVETDAAQASMSQGDVALAMDNPIASPANAVIPTTEATGLPSFGESLLFQSETPIVPGPNQVDDMQKAALKPFTVDHFSAESNASPASEQKPDLNQFFEQRQLEMIASPKPEAEQNAAPALPYAMPEPEASLMPSVSMENAQPDCPEASIEMVDNFLLPPSGSQIESGSVLSLQDGLEAMPKSSEPVSEESFECLDPLFTPEPVGAESDAFSSDDNDLINSLLDNLTAASMPSTSLPVIEQSAQTDMLAFEPSGVDVSAPVASELPDMLDDLLAPPVLEDMLSFSPAAPDNVLESPQAFSMEPNQPPLNDLAVGSLPDPETALNHGSDSGNDMAFFLPEAGNFSDEEADSGTLSLTEAEASAMVDDLWQEMNVLPLGETTWTPDDAQEQPVDLSPLQPVAEDSLLPGAPIQGVSDEAVWATDDFELLDNHDEADYAAEATPFIPPMSDRLSQDGNDSMLNDEEAPWQASEADECYALSDDSPDTHYFGDEAEGLKYADDSASYDLGYYSDPEDGDNLFVLEDAESPDFGLLNEDNFSTAGIMNESSAVEATPQAEFPVNDVPCHPAPIKETVEPAVSASLDLITSLSNTYASDDSKEALPLLRDEETVRADAPLRGEQSKSEIEDAFAAYASPSVSSKVPAKLPAFEADAGKPGPARKSIVDALNSFEQEVLLKDSRFLKSSIDALVNGYFSQQDG